MKSGAIETRFKSRRKSRNFFEQIFMHLLVEHRRIRGIHECMKPPVRGIVVECVLYVQNICKYCYNVQSERPNDKKWEQKRILSCN
jgi:hypothetical protein